MKAIHYGLTLGVMLLASHALRAQEYKIPVENTKDGQLILNDFTGELPVEGYNGTEIIFTTDKPEEVPDQAKGLKRVFPAGTDNTGMGLSVTKDGNHITVQCLVPFTRDASFRVKVPNNLRLKIVKGCERSGTVTIANMSSEVDVNNCHNIELKGVTGPLVLSTIDGEIKAVFSEVSKDKPISIASISGEIDITLPAKTPVDLEMSDMSGNMYSDFDLQSSEKEMRRVGGNNLKASLNGGGVDFKITSISGNIYLRKG
jgi:lia operon protein LiaG